MSHQSSRYWCSQQTGKVTIRLLGSAGRWGSLQSADAWETSFPWNSWHSRNSLNSKCKKSCKKDGLLCSICRQWRPEQSIQGLHCPLTDGLDQIARMSRLIWVFAVHLLLWISRYFRIYQGPVVQSIISLTSLLVVKMLTVLVSKMSNSQIFLLKKCE